MGTEYSEEIHRLRVSMINNMRVLAFIPARGGSKGIKDKNIRVIEGRPLISYTIEAAKHCGYIDDVIVSTDSETIAQVARENGAEVPFMRPEELASDTARTIDSVIYTIEMLKAKGRWFDIVVLLQPTSPLRDADDISGALEKFIACDMQSLVAVSEVSESPILIRQVIDETHMDKLIDENSTVRRQDMTKYYRVNGSIYINLTEELSSETSFNDNQVPYVIKRSHAVDIDEYVDIEVMKYYLSNEKTK